MSTRLLQIIGWGALALTLLWVAYGIWFPRGLLLDFANFYDAGQKARVGEFASLYDPFATIAGQPPYGNMSFFSAPLTSYLYLPLAMLDPKSASVLFKLAGTLAQGLGLWLLYRHFRALVGADVRAQAGYFALFAVAVLLFQPFWVIYAVGGQTTPFVFLALVLGYLCHQRGQFVALAVLLSLVVVIKPAFVPAAVLLFFCSSAGFRLTALIAAMAVGAGSLALFGVGLHQEFLARVLAETSGLAAPWQNSNPFSWIEPLFVPPEAYQSAGQLPDGARLLVTLLRFGTAVVLIWVMILHLRSVLAQAAARHLVFVTALALVVVLSPVVWSHYLVVLFVVLVPLIALRGGLSVPARVVLAAAVVLAVGQNLILLNRLIRVVGVETTASITALALMKSLPALLIVGTMLLAYRSMGRVLHDPGWKRLPG